ncbi:phosphate acyltransferase PlsX [Niastella populi]|uniref:Phosphate acyltransferase n=1 Tax=Niastella populi TaxID=550983 RepID=A0A1V9FXI1_9BACT|nr:phosphate acyltransferase PlsX [Niastella populi]OQP63030.1 phosphate acyltransferase PlsX [Niastella populi]
MTICLDMMGGDFAPLEAVKGVRDYLTEAVDPALLFLVGDEAQINPLLQQHQIPAEKVRVFHAPQVIDYNESPTKALKEKQQSSIAVGFHLLATGKAGAFISAGNTGAMLVGAMYSIKPIEGVQRPTISTIIPKDNGNTGLLLDVGLNADCKPEHLNQFALLGSLYAKHILGIDNPRVALLNIGEEEGKGNLLAQSTYPLLKENSQINFVGNVEGRDILLDKADVMVCDGFTGNVILKMAESLYEITHRKELKHEYLDRFNFELYGGTPVLGVAKPVIIGHGISHAKAFSNMIHLAQKMIATDLMGKMKASITPNA